MNTSAEGLLENLRKVISLVDQLRDIGLNDYIKLPRIVVLGIQSAGKSSLLEQIVGIDFLPRGSGVVTRRPLELRLSYVPKSQQAETTAEFVKEVAGKKFTDFSKVKQTIIELTDKVCGNSKNIKDIPIILSVSGPTCPDLTLVDLPGITRIPLEGQDKDIEKITTDMARRYCEDESTIILCAVAANADMSTSDALLMAKRLDPSGERTIGVLTKIDLMDTGTNALKMLRGEDVPLKYGYVGVKLRSQQDINDNISVQVAITKEKSFFANHQVYSSIPGEIFGTTVLTTRLTRILYKHIRSFLPKLMTEINFRVKKIEERVTELGPGLPIEDSDKLHYIWQLIHEFSVKFKNSITGQYEKSKMAKLALPPAGAKIRLLFQNLFDDFADPEYKSLKKRKDDEIQQVIQKYQAQPGFLPVDAFYALLDPELKKLTNPALDCVEETYGILESYANQILESQLKQLPSVHQLLRDQVLLVLNQCKKQAQEAVKEVLEAESNYIFTNDSNYLAGKAFRRYNSEVVKDDKPTKGDPMVNELKSKIEHFFKLVVRATRDNIPKIIGYFLVKGCQQKMLITLQQNLMQNPEFLTVVSEPPLIVEERKKLNKEIETFRNAQKLIKRDPDLSEYILKVVNEDTPKPPPQKKEEKPATQPAQQQVQQEKPVQKPNDTTVKAPVSQQQPQQTTQQQQQAQQQSAQQQATQQQAQLKPNTPTQQQPPKPTNNDPLAGKTQQPQPQKTVTQQYNQAVDKGVNQIFDDDRTKKAMADAGGQAARTALASQVPGAPDWALNAAQNAGSQAASSDAARQAAKDSVAAQLKPGEPEPPKKAGLFGFIKK